MATTRPSTSPSNRKKVSRSTKKAAKKAEAAKAEAARIEQLTVGIAEIVEQKSDLVACVAG